MREDASTHLLGRIAETGLRPEIWSDVLEDLAAFAGARGALLIPLNGDVAGLQVTSSLHELLDVYVGDGWSTNDFRYRGEVKMLRDGITVDQDFVDADRMRTEPFYEAFLRPLGFKFFAGLAMTSGASAWALTLQRGIASDPFGPEEQATLVRFVGPLQDSVRIGRALGSAYARGSVDQLSAQEVACLLFDETGRVAYLNEAAGQLLGDIIDVTHGILRLKASGPTQDLNRRIKLALKAPALDDPADPAPLLIGAPIPQYMLTVTRLPRCLDTVFQVYRGMVQIRPIHRNLDLDIALIEQAYRLTPKEAEVLRALARHSSLTAAARSIGMAHETARSHVRSLFAKTGTNSQVGLISAIASFPRRTGHSGLSASTAASRPAPRRSSRRRGR